MARSFNGTSNTVTVSPGAFNGVPFTYGTIAAILRVTPDNDWQEYLSHNSGSAVFAGLNLSNVWNCSYDGSANGASNLSPVSGEWYCVIISKPTGTAAASYNVYRYSTGGWLTATSGTMANGSANTTNLYLGSYQGSFEHWNGDIQAVGLFRQLVPADNAEAQSLGLHVSRLAWLRAAARSDLAAVWLFDQSATTMPVRDVTGGGANESGGTAPGVSTVHPPLFTYAAPVVAGPQSLPPPVTDWLNPASDVATNGWVTDLLVNSNIYTAIDEDTASDADYIQCSTGATSSNFYETALQSQVGDAALSTLHTVSYRLAKVGSTAADLTVSLRQGAGTEIASWTHTGLSTSFAGFDQTLSAAQADAITYPTDLRIRFAPTTNPTPPSLVADRGSIANTAITDPTVVSVTGNTTVGNYMLARVAVDNSGSQGARPGLAVTDSAGNTWTVGTGGLADPGAERAGSACYIAYAKINTQLTTSSTVSFDFTTVPGATPFAKSIVLEEWRGIHGTTPVAVAEVQASGATTAFTITANPTAANQLAYFVCSVEGPSGDTFPSDADVTALTRLSTADATAAANQTNNGAYRATTASGAVTWNGTLGTARDWAAAAVVFANDGSTSRTLVSWAGMTIPYAAPPATERWQPRFIYQPAAQRASTW